MSISELELKLREAKYEHCERSYEYFFKQAWQSFDPEPFLDNWHIGCLCEHLQAQHEGVPELRNMIVNIQPRLSKSKTISVGFPAWVWINNPVEKFVCVSHSDRLVKDLTTNGRTLIQSPWYEYRWVGPNKVFELSKDSNTVNRFDNNKGGYRIGTTPLGAGLGFGYSHLIIDDPNDLMDIYSDPALQRTINFYKGVLRNRINNANTGKKTLVQQRLSLKDLTQWLLENEEGKWFLLVIPSEYTKHYTFKSPIGVDDPREKEGELVCPNRFNKEFYEEEKKWPERWSALYQQKPVQEGGAIIKEKWIQYYDNIPLDSMDQVIISVDLAVEDKKENDYSVFTIWGKRGSKYYLIDMVRDRLDFQSQLRTMIVLAEKYPQARGKLVEKKGTGSPLMNMLENKISGLIPVNPVGSKTQRLFACVPEFVSECVFLPSPNLHDWVKDVIEELTKYPKSRNDDIVDSVTMALNYLAIQNSASEAFIFNENKNSINNRLSEFNNNIGEKYKVAVYTRGSVKKIFSWD